jgi:predicted transcriptional regulator
MTREAMIRYTRIFDMVYGEELLSSSRTRDVLCFLCYCAGGEGKASPSYATIARKCNIERRTVSKALKELQAAKFIKIENQYHENGGKATNLYTILDPTEEK